MALLVSQRRRRQAVAALAVLWGLGAAVVAVHGQTAPPLAVDEQLWQTISALRAQALATPPGTAWFASAVPQREALLRPLGLYIQLYPGGPHVDEAVQWQLAALYELGVLAGGEFDRLARQVEAYMAHPQSQTTLHEAAYWQIVCRRARAVAASRPVAAPGSLSDPELLRDYQTYVQDYPRSRHTPRLAAIVFDDALRRRDRATMEALVAHLREHWPESAVTLSLAARLARVEAVGQPFDWRLVDSGPAPTGSERPAGRPAVIVVWSGGEPESLECVRAVEALRLRHTELHVVGINVEPGAARAEMAAGAGVAWPQVRDGLGLAGWFVRHWGVSAVPFVFVIDRDGVLRGATAGPEWRAWADEVLGLPVSTAPAVTPATSGPVGRRN